MKFKERRGNVFVFDGGYDLEELELERSVEAWGVNEFFMFEDVIIHPNLEIVTSGSSYRDIQTAVNLMNILKDEGSL